MTDKEIIIDTEEMINLKIITDTGSMREEM